MFINWLLMVVLHILNILKIILLIVYIESIITLISSKIITSYFINFLISVFLFNGFFWLRFSLFILYFRLYKLVIFCIHCLARFERLLYLLDIVNPVLKACLLFLPWDLIIWDFKIFSPLILDRYLNFISIL